MGDFLNQAADLLRAEQFKEQPLKDQPRGSSPGFQSRTFSRGVASTDWCVVARAYPGAGVRPGVIKLGLQLAPSGYRYGTEFRFSSIEHLRTHLHGVIAELEACAASDRNLLCPECGSGRMMLVGIRPEDPWFRPLLVCERTGCPGKRQGVIEVEAVWNPENSR
jgi:hypothetical protein